MSEEGISQAIRTYAEGLHAETIKKLADQLAEMFPTLTRVELERAAVAGVSKARDLRDREAGRKAQSAASKKLCKE